MSHQKLHTNLRSLRFTSCRVNKPIRSFITFTLRALIYVDPLKIHFYNRNCSVPKKVFAVNDKLMCLKVFLCLTLDTQCV